MSWSDPGRRFEPAEDAALRDELRDLLGAPAPRPSRAEVTPVLSALADDLHREAQRRRRLERKRPTWTLLAAAALPFALGLAGTSWWGVQQKRRADTLAAHVERQNVEMERMARAGAAGVARDRQADPAALPSPVAPEQSLERVAQDAKAHRRSAPRSGDPYLVIPVRKGASAPPETVEVKARP